MFTHGHHIIDTANRLDPAEPDSAEGGLPPPINPSGSYGGVMANPTSSGRQTSGQQYSGDAGLAAAGVGATALGGRDQLSSTTRVSQPYASDPVTTARTGTGQQQGMGASALGSSHRDPTGSTDGYGSRGSSSTSGLTSGLGASGTSGMTSQGRDPYDSSSTGRDMTGQHQYGRDAALAGTGVAGVAGYEAYEHGRGQGAASMGSSSNTTGSQPSSMLNKLDPRAQSGSSSSGQMGSRYI